MHQPERLIQNRLDTYGIEISEVRLEPQGGVGSEKIYTLLNPPIDPQTGVTLENWTITKYGTTGMMVMVSCDDIANAQAVSAKQVVLTMEQEKLLENYEKLTDVQKQQLFMYVQTELGGM